MRILVGQGGRRTSGERQRGAALLWAAATMAITAGAILASTDRMTSLDRITRAEFGAEGQATMAAEAGLVDAYAWLRRQQTQPVTVFAPRRNLTADPPVNETDDATAGLLRTYEISPGLWARYLVRPGAAAEPFIDGDADGLYDLGESFTDTDGNARWTPAHGTRDISADRGLPGAGAVWRLVCRGEVFRRSDATQALGEGPNVRVAATTMACEVRRLTLSPPASAALCATWSASVTVGDRGRLRSGGTAIAYRTDTGPVTLLSGSQLLAPTQTALVPGYSDTTESVFSVGMATLRAMADLSTTDPATGIPNPLPTYGLVVATGDAVFDAARPLKGTGVLVVEGNVTIQAGSNSIFNGLLYVTGNLVVRGPALLRGSVIVRGSVDVRGSGGDFAEVEEDPALLTQLMTHLGQYRLSKVPYPPAPWFTDGRPDEASARRGRFAGH